MKKLSYLLTLLLLVTLMTGCKAFHTLMDSKLKAAQGAPYELIVVCNQQLWESELGDTLRSVLLAPIPYLNEREPLFNVMQFPGSGFKVRSSITAISSKCSSIPPLRRLRPVCNTMLRLLRRSW